MNDFEHLPEDLQDIARALAVHRDVPDGHLLERVLARVKAAPRPRRGFAGFFRARLAALSMLVLCLGLNVTGALAAVLQSLGVSSSTANSLNLSNIITSLTQTVSTGSNFQSAADEVYCEENGKSGSDDNAQGGSEQNNGTWSSPSTTGTKSDSEQNGGTEENNGGGNGQCCPTGTGGGGNDTTDQNGSQQMSTTNGTKSDSETNGGTEDNNGGGNGQCCPTSSGSGGSSGGSETNMSPVSNVVTSPTTTSGSGKSKVTTYTTTTTTTTPMPDMGSGNSCGCPPSGSTGSEQNGGSEKVDTKVDTYTNGKLTNTTTGTTFKSTDSGSENNGGGSCTPPPEKPGCGNEQAGQNGLSGASGVHGGQPPKAEDRGQCPHQPGQEGPTGESD